MGAWVDDPDLTDELGGKLVEILVEAVDVPPDIEAVLEDVGVPIGRVPFTDRATAATVWPVAMRVAAELHLLRDVVEYVRDSKPMTNAALQTILDSTRTAGAEIWYRCRARENACLVGPGARRAVIDRAGLRDALVAVTGAAGYPVLSINSAGTFQGKSHSRYLLQHIVEGSRAWQLTVIDVEVLWPETGGKLFAREFVETLSGKLGLLRDYNEVSDLTEASRIARELVIVFAGRFKSLPPQNRVIFIDGLDRTNVQADVAVAVAHLASDIETGELGTTRLVLTGYQGRFASSVQQVLRQEWIGRIGTTHLERFFETIGTDVGEPLKIAQVRDLVAKTARVASFDDMLKLGREASRVAHEHFGRRP